jgi:para-nitrobenzyl esterase
MNKWGAILFCVACSSGSSQPTEASLDVTTASGVVHGASADGVHSFLGIPFAAPPTGPLRFLPPKPATPWTTPRAAATFGADCAQLSTGGTLSATSSEDCLYVNVWTPAAPVTKAPVYLWIYGGGFVSGSGASAVYNGSNLVIEENAIVVTFNYRLGALGFFAHPAVAAEEGVATAPNAGLADQQAALKWVHDNIAAFGGDPANVTLAGESAGAISVCAHLAMPGSKGLFARAIMESGACINAAFTTKALAEDQATRLATAVSCSDLVCLRAKTAEEILKALPGKKALVGPGDAYFPLVDGTLVPLAPLDAIASGSWANVPTLLGTNVNEGALFLYLWGNPPPTSADVRLALSGLFGASTVDAIAAEYGVDATPSQAFTDIITEGVFACPARRAARAISAAGASAWLYQFTYAYTLALFPGITTAHAFELPFVFHNAFGQVLTDADVAMSDTVDGYWFRFARTGDPNGAGAVPWPAFTQASDANVVLDTTVSTNTGLKKAKCDFWDGIE